MYSLRISTLSILIFADLKANRGRSTHIIVIILLLELTAICQAVRPLLLFINMKSPNKILSFEQAIS